MKICKVNIEVIINIDFDVIMKRALIDDKLIVTHIIDTDILSFGIANPVFMDTDIII